MEHHRVLFVCMGNICRSPTAEAVARKIVNDAGLQHCIEVDSAGTHDYHVGQPPDVRSRAAARQRGYEMGGLRARQVVSTDFDSFDLILSMDFNNFECLQRICPAEHQSKLGLLMPYASRRSALIVHDPYYRSPKEFELVLDYIEDACEGLIRALMPQDALSARMNRHHHSLRRMPAGASGGDPAERRSGMQ